MAIKQQDTTVNNLVIDRLLNYPNAGDGARVLPPRLRGETRVPVPSGFVLFKTTPAAPGTIYSLGWKAPNGDASLIIAGYRIYSTAHSSGSPPQTISQDFQQSPATFYLPYDSTVPVTFAIQTILVSGLASNGALSPTVSFATF